MVKSDNRAKPRLFTVEDINSVIYGLFVGDLAGVIDLVSFMRNDPDVDASNLGEKYIECQIALSSQFSWNPIDSAHKLVRVFPLARTVPNNTPIIYRCTCGSRKIETEQWPDGTFCACECGNSWLSTK